MVQEKQATMAILDISEDEDNVLGCWILDSKNEMRKGGGLLGMCSKHHNKVCEV